VLEYDVEEEFAVRDFKVDRPNRWRGVVVDSDDKEIVEAETWANGVKVERECGVRLVDGIIVCVEVVESEDEEDEEDGAGEYGRDEDVGCDGNNGVGMS
jgi:hypothetical protein